MDVKSSKPDFAHPECRYYTALVTFERTEQETEHLPEDAHGAVGYFAIASSDEKSAIEILHRGLEHEGLRLTEVDELCEFEFPNLPDLDDDYLFANIANWDPDKYWTWGTLHIYIADGQA